MHPIYSSDVPLLPTVRFIYIYSTNILFNYFFRLSPFLFIRPQNLVHFIILPFLVHKIFTLYINGVLNCKCSALGPKGYPLCTQHPIYRTDVPILPTVRFLYIQSTNIFNYFFLDFLPPSSFIPPQNVLYFLMLPFLVHKIFTFYINCVLTFWPRIYFFNFNTSCI